MGYQKIYEWAEENVGIWDGDEPGTMETIATSAQKILELFEEIDGVVEELAELDVKI